MLQKSRSKSIAKFKYLLLVPLMLGMLTYVSCTSEKEELRITNSEMVEDGVLTIRVSDVQNQTAEEINRIEEATRNMSTDGYHTVRVTDGGKTVETAMVPPAPPAPPMTALPFTTVEEAPVFPGCEDMASKEANKDCMVEKITEYVNSNFNTEAVKPYAEEGVNRIYAQFIIDTSGKIQSVKTRASNKELQEEAARVILGLPQMKPAQHNGANAAVQYALPIVFQN